MQILKSDNHICIRIFSHSLYFMFGKGEEPLFFFFTTNVFTSPNKKIVRHNTIMCIDHKDLVISDGTFMIIGN